MRKLVLTLLVGAICLVGATSALAQFAQPYNLDEYERMSGKTLTFSEAPMLRTMVAAGDLPPLEERLPVDPLVVIPSEEIGQYGGTLHLLNEGPGKSNFSDDYTWEYMTAYSPDMTRVFPNVLKGWEASADGKTFTLYLRKGMRWSDGIPFTADDLLFFWDDVAQNKQLTPSPRSWMMSGGEPGVMTKIDDYTVEVSFKRPYGLFIESFTRWRPNPYLPKHYLKQFHPKYTAEDVLKKRMKDEGLDTWISLFAAKDGGMYPWRLPELPTLAAWVAQNLESAPIQIMTRNPYYWKVDTEGNQLPYIDRMERVLVEDREAQLLKIIAGDVDTAPMSTYGMESKSLVIDLQEGGDYRITQSLHMPDNVGAVQFNMTHKDPVLRKLFNDKNFRIALQVARDLEEINELVNAGLGVPSNPTFSSGPPFYGEKIFKKYLQYDPDLANQLLDELGLTSRDNDGYRLRSDGERLRFQCIVYPWPDNAVEICELYSIYWEEVGIEVVIKPTADAAWEPVKLSGDWDISSVIMPLGGRPVNPLVYYTISLSLVSWSIGSPDWTLWILTDGEEGVEPPEDIKRIEELRKQAYAEPDEQKRIDLTLEIAKIYEENFWTLGGINMPAANNYRIANNALRNVPDPNRLEFIHDIPAQLFFRK